MTTSSKFALALILAGLLIVAVTGAVLQLGATWVCGSADLTSLYAGPWFIITGDVAVLTVPAGCDLPITVLRVVAGLAVLLIIAGAIAAAAAYGRYRQSDAHFISEVKGRRGFATASEIRKHLSARAVLKRAPQLRPGLPTPQPADVGWSPGRSYGMDVYLPLEDSAAIEGPPRSGKGFRVVIKAILDWSGPLVTTSTTTDNLVATMRMRQARGDVHVFDPQQITGVDRALRIDPIRGCEDPLVAVQRAKAIVAGTALGTSSKNQEWAEASGTILAQLLHAAAVGGKGVRELHGWGSTEQLAQEAVNILRVDGAAGWGDSLESVLRGDPKMLSSYFMGVKGAVAPLAIPQIRAALEPQPGERVFDPAEFLGGQNTLYLIGSAGGAGAMGGFLAGILDDVVEVARRKALASPNSRLQLPLGLILDEIVNMFSWNNLPRIMADGGGRGICTLVVLQALSQAETAWSKAEADTIWSAANAKIILGGAADVDHLRDIEALLGTRQERRTDQSWSSHQAGVQTSQRQERLPLMSVDEIRRMPQSMGLLAYRNRRGVLLELAGWTERSDGKRIGQHKTDTEREHHAVFEGRYRVEPPAAVPEAAAADES